MPPSVFSSRSKDEVDGEGFVTSLAIDKQFVVPEANHISCGAYNLLGSSEGLARDKVASDASPDPFSSAPRGLPCH